MFLCHQSSKASPGVRYSLDDQMSLKFNMFKAIFCFFWHLLNLTFFTIFSLESRRAQASISLECETGLTNCIILAPWILAAGVLKRKKRMWNSRRKIYDKWIKGWHALKCQNHKLRWKEKTSTACLITGFMFGKQMLITLVDCRSRNNGLVRSGKGWSELVCSHHYHPPLETVFSRPRYSLTLQLR